MRAPERQRKQASELSLLLRAKHRGLDNFLGHWIQESKVDELTGAFQGTHIR